MSDAAALLKVSKASTMCLRVFLHGSKVMKSKWKESVSYDRLLNVMQSLGQPDKALLLRLCDMVSQQTANCI